jgi:anti-anti-sigma factor
MATDSRYGVDRPRDLGALRMRSIRDGDTHHINLAGELDLATAAAVEHELRRVELTDAHVTAIDLRELTFIESTGIRLILEAYMRSSEGGHRLVVVRGSEAIQRLFRTCDVERRLPFVDRLPADDMASSPGALRRATSRRASQGALAAAVRELRTQRRSGVLR